MKLFSTGPIIPLPSPGSHFGGGPVVESSPPDELPPPLLLPPPVVSDVVPGTTPEVVVDDSPVVVVDGSIVVVDVVGSVVAVGSVVVSVVAIVALFDSDPPVGSEVAASVLVGVVPGPVDDAFVASLDEPGPPLALTLASVAPDESPHAINSPRGAAHSCGRNRSTIRPNMPHLRVDPPEVHAWYYGLL